MVTNPFYEAVRKKIEEISRNRNLASDKHEKHTDIINWKAYYDFACLCTFCYQDLANLKRVYKGALSFVSEARRKDITVKFFVLSYPKKQTHYVVLAGWLWVKELKRMCVNSQPFLWRELLHIEQLQYDIYKMVARKTNKDWELRIIGHSLGAIHAVLLGDRMKRKGYNVVQVVTFGQPMMMEDAGENSSSPLHSLSILRIVDAHDPIRHCFHGYKHVGREITLLARGNYCFETKTTESESEVVDDILFSPLLTKKRKKKKGEKIFDEGVLSYHLMDYYIKRLDRKSVV